MKFYDISDKRRRSSDSKLENYRVFYGKKIHENSLIFLRAVSIISTDRDKFDLSESDVFENPNDESDDNYSVCTDDSSPNRDSDSE